jgi:hypothetical protein
VASGYGVNRVVKAVQVTSGGAVSQCPGPCTVQDIVLPCTPADNDVDCGADALSGCKSCIQGKVVDENGNPVAAMLKVKTGVNTLTAVTDSSGHYCSPAALDTLTTVIANGADGVGSVSTTATTKGSCPNCDKAADIVIKKNQSSTSDSGLDFSKCPTDVGGLKITRLQANGTDPALGALDSGWLMVQKGSSSGTAYTLSGVLVSSKASGVSFAPQATFTLELPAAPTAGAVYPVTAVSSSSYRISGQASSSNGAPEGMGNETYKIDTATSYSSTVAMGSGQITFTTAFANVGDPVKGSLSLTFAANCAAPSASLTLQATIDTAVTDASSLLPTSYDPNSPIYKDWVCGFFELMSWSTQGFSTGAAQVVVDGVPLSGANPLNSVEYQWNTDTLNISYYGDTGTFMATVDKPKLGANTLSSAMYTESGGANDCLFMLKTGTVTITDFAGKENTRWMTGSFQVDLSVPDYAGSAATCGTRSAMGQFGAPVCAGY